MVNDKVLFGAFSGIISDIVMDIIQYPLWKMMIIKHPLAHYAGSIFIGNMNTLHHTWIGSTVSFLADYAYSALLGVVFVYLVHFFWKNAFILVKGTLFGVFLWFVSYGGLRALPIVRLREVQPGDIIIFLVIHLIFGFSLGYMVKKYGNIFLERKRDV